MQSKKESFLYTIWGKNSRKGCYLYKAFVQMMAFFYPTLSVSCLFLHIFIIYPPLLWHTKGEMQRALTPPSRRVISEVGIKTLVATHQNWWFGWNFRFKKRRENKNTNTWENLSTTNNTDLIAPPTTTTTQTHTHKATKSINENLHDPVYTKLATGPTDLH